LLIANATATHRLVRDVPGGFAGSGEHQLRFDVVCDGGVDDLAVDPAAGLEVDAHPVGRRGSNRHSLFDTDADEPGMDIEDALPAAERQQVGILDKRLLQTLAEAVGIKAGPPRETTRLGFGKLAGKVDDKARKLPGGHALNAGAALLSLVLGLMYCNGSGIWVLLVVMTALVLRDNQNPSSSDNLPYIRWWNSVRWESWCQARSRRRRGPKGPGFTPA
jgi:hypothetical protein